MGRDGDGIGFRSSTPVVFQMYPVVTLEELKPVILRNMGLGAVATSLVRRVAYRLLNVFLPDPFKFKIFWVDSDEHVRALFDLHSRYETHEVMELLTKMQSMPEVGGGSSSSDEEHDVAPGVLTQRVGVCVYWNVLQPISQPYHLDGKGLLRGVGRNHWACTKVLLHHVPRLLLIMLLKIPYTPFNRVPSVRRPRWYATSCRVMVYSPHGRQNVCVSGLQRSTNADRSGASKSRLSHDRFSTACGASPAGAPWPASSAGSGVGSARAALLERPRGAI
ncbi:hypothetical protein PIB30_019166 [Stylosanthes scabra]|uniref:Uncharacterized protein n=1 Tax=Stylosanthes scabra TaxID=79078 RepID=A0ABU6YA00_9FABA|nr:hypothetical protein [Stylosanthes scabra]